MLVSLLVTMLCGHLLGDFIFQNGWQAENKKKIWIAAIGHGASYALAISIFYVATSLLVVHSDPERVMCGVLIILWTLTPMHSLTDKYFNGPKYWDFIFHMIQDVIIVAPLIYCF